MFLSMDLICLRVSIPSIPGILRSVMTRSGFSFSVAGIAASPVGASITP